VPDTLDRARWCCWSPSSRTCRGGNDLRIFMRGCQNIHSSKSEPHIGGSAIREANTPSCRGLRPLEPVKRVYCCIFPSTYIRSSRCKEARSESAISVPYNSLSTPADLRPINFPSVYYRNCYVKLKISRFHMLCPDTKGDESAENTIKSAFQHNIRSFERSTPNDDSVVSAGSLEMLI